MTTGKALLIVGGVAVGAYVLLSLVKGGTPSGPTRAPLNTDYGFVSSLLNFGTAAFGAFGAPNASPVYVPGQGYVSGGANAPIDPTTGGVMLPDGETYGPRFSS